MNHKFNHLTYQREQRAERERRDREWAEEQDRRKERERVERLRKGRREFVEPYVQNLEEITRLESVLNCFEQRLEKEEGENLAEFEAMIAWCRDEIARLGSGMEPTNVESRIERWSGSFISDEEDFFRGHW